MIDDPADPEAHERASSRALDAGSGLAPTSTDSTDEPADPRRVTAPLVDPGTARSVQVEAAADELGLSALGPLSSERKGREWSLVLQSMGVWHALRSSYGGWFVLVHDADRARASAAIERYEEENRDWPPRETRERPRFAGTPLAPFLFIALAVFFMAATGPAAAGSRWFQHGTAVSDLVVGSQPWRAVTALTLHADSVHVIGNVISGAIFASAVDRRLGPGVSALAVLVAGAAGNAANAAWHHAIGEGFHGSIGASTAVFGAVGLLAASQLVLDRSHAPRGRRWLEIVAPIAGGAALLGALGASPQADLGAHLFGFLAGLVLGLPLALFARRKRAAGTRWWAQAGSAALAVGLVVGAWQLAMR